MRPLLSKIKPTGGFSYFFHIALTILLPAAVFIFVRIHFIQLALTIILLSKWRMFAVRPRFWPANIRANSVDLIVGLSLLIFMVHADTQWLQVLWATVYGIWLIFLKPAEETLLVSLQAMVGLLLGLTAIFGTVKPLYYLVFLSGTICYLAARHFFDNFDEPYAKFLSYVWGYFGASLTWVLGHWLLFYGAIAQPTVILLVIGYGLSALYYFAHFDRLSPLLRRQFIFIMVAIVVVILTFSDWGSKIV
jgi:hypothetical protein